MILCMCMGGCRKLRVPVSSNHETLRGIEAFGSFPGLIWSGNETNATCVRWEAGQSMIELL